MRESMMSQMPCPDVPALERFLFGRLPTEEAASLEQHLQVCELCLARLQTLQSDDSMVKAIQAGSDKVHTTAHEGVHLLAAWLKKLRPKFDDHAAAVPNQPGLMPGTDTTELERQSDDIDDTVDFPFLDPQQQPNELGRLGQYQVRKVLGTGGMGIVFEAFDPALDRLVALKTMLPALAENATARQRFLREAKAAARIKHDHIVTIYQVGEDRGICYLAMEYLEGESLDRRLARAARLPLPDVLRIGRECAEALAAAHAHGLIHRDIKPANIWLEQGRAAHGDKRNASNPVPANHAAPVSTDHSAGVTLDAPYRVKILDFGLAQPTDQQAHLSNAHLTQSGAVMGTPAFMAPEQLRAGVVDARADLFSLGCVLYRLATGEPPFRGTHAISTLIAVATINPRPPQEVDQTLPQTLCDLILRLLAKNPDDRPRSAMEVVEALRAVELKSPVGTDRSGTSVAPSPAKLGARRARRRIAIASVGLSLLAVVIGLSYLVWHQAHEPGDGKQNPSASHTPAPRTPHDPVIAVEGAGASPTHIYSDKAHSLGEILDFRELANASLQEYRDWHAALDPEFRLVQVSRRCGNGPVLFNAVAVKEERPVLARVMWDGMPDKAEYDWDRNCLDGFRMLGQCAFPIDAESWRATRIWVRDGIGFYSNSGSSLDRLKQGVQHFTANATRPVSLEWPAVHDAPTYLSLAADDQDRKCEVLWTLTAERLARTTELFKLKNWRPDVIAPHRDDGQLRFDLVAIDNKDGPDWRFQMDMSRHHYRAESIRQRKRGWLPIALISYGDDADEKYAAIWVHARIGGFPDLPRQSDGAAPRPVVNAVDFVAPNSKAIYQDNARALGEITDFRELVGATTDDFKSWQDKLGADFRIAYLAHRKGAGADLYNAVAVRDKQPVPTRLLFGPDPEAASVEWQRLINDEGYRPIASIAIPTKDLSSPRTHQAVFVKDGHGPVTWHGGFEDIVKNNRDSIGQGVRTIHVSGTVDRDELGFNTVLGPDEGRSWDILHALHPEELGPTVDFYRRKQWRPDVIAPYWHGQQLRFMLVILDNPEQLDWAFRMDMSRDEYQEESARRKRQGLFPLSLTSHSQSENVRYNAIFGRYRPAP
jgi:serine/threonine protein kinase